MPGIAQQEQVGDDGVSEQLAGQPGGIDEVCRRRVAEGRSLASGLYNLAYYGGGAVGAGICGRAYMAGGWPATVATIAGVQALAIIVAGFGWRRRP